VYDGQIVGAVGVSGGNGEQDKAVGAAALQAFAEHVAQDPAPIRPAQDPALV
jgi:hypothetical protein